MIEEGQNLGGDEIQRKCSREKQRVAKCIRKFQGRKGKGHADMEGMLIWTMDYRPQERSPDRKHNLLAFWFLPKMEKMWESSETTRDHFNEIILVSRRD